MKECRAAYDEWEFRRVFTVLNQFCAVDLSALLHRHPQGPDVLRSCEVAPPPQRADGHDRVFDALCRLLAPILVFTADEAWEFAGHVDSIHVEDFPEPDSAFARPVATPKIEALLRLREVVQREIEKLRQARTVGSNNEAAVIIELPADDPASPLATDLETVGEFMILSDLTIRMSPDGAALRAEATRSAHSKCERCWRLRPDVGREAAHPSLCGRCAAVVTGA